MEDTAATRALKLILIFDGLPKRLGQHEILASLAFNHLLGAQHTFFGEELEDRCKLILIGVERAREVTRPERRSGTHPGEALIDLFDHTEQIRMITCNSV